MPGASFNGAGVRGRRRVVVEVHGYGFPTVLQRGRRPRTPESGQRYEEQTGIYAASTGPASEDAGEFSRGYRGGRRSTGFNGAGVRGRRRVAGGGAFGFGHCGFNGAGVRGRRRGEDFHGFRLGQYRASTGPASEDAARDSRGIVRYQERERLLQRGRRPRTPERSDSNPASRWVRYELQRGRRPRTPERWRRSVVELVTNMLQRGRRPRTPEIMTSSTGWPPIWGLQWGRRPRTPRAVARLASTAQIRCVLQRGRRPRTPERT